MRGRPGHRRHLGDLVPTGGFWIGGASGRSTRTAGAIRCAARGFRSAVIGVDDTTSSQRGNRESLIRDDFMGQNEAIVGLGDGAQATPPPAGTCRYAPERGPRAIAGAPLSAGSIEVPFLIR